MFRPLISKLPTQSYIQTINVQNDKYKQYPNKKITQTIINHNTAAIKGKE